jgi:chemotaxis protein methyltransferase CheR
VIFVSKGFTVLEITEEQFKRFQTLIYKHCGIRLDDRKQLLLRTRLQRRLRQIPMDDVEKYLAIVTRPGGAEEFQSLIDVVTTNETSFFRTQSHFDWFSNVFLPEVHARRGTPGSSRELRLWSAACSNGAEAYSLAFCLHDHRNLVQGIKVKILASDLCVSALDQARTAKYPQRFVDALAPATRKQFFDEVAALPGTSSTAPREYQVRSEFRDQVEWVHHNLMHPLNRPLMDCVFLRNVLIYFDEASKQAVLTNVINQIAPGGYLVVGPSEGIYGLENPLKKINTFLYQKNPNSLR